MNIPMFRAGVKLLFRSLNMFVKAKLSGDPKFVLNWRLNQAKISFRVIRKSLKGVES